MIRALRPYSAAQTGTPPESLHHLTVAAAAIKDLRKRLVASTFKDRRRLPAMDERRAIKSLIRVGSP